MKKALLTGIAALFLATGTAHAEDIFSCKCPDEQARCKMRDNPEFYKNEDPEIYAQIVKCGWVAPNDFCQDNRCFNENGETCYKLSNCCKNRHDWATQLRDETVCKRKPTKCKLAPDQYYCG